MWGRAAASPGREGGLGQGGRACEGGRQRVRRAGASPGGVQAVDCAHAHAAPRGIAIGQTPRLSAEGMRTSPTTPKPERPVQKYMQQVFMSMALGAFLQGAGVGP